MWKVRKKGGARPVGRVYTIHPSAGDAFYLRTLLHNVTGEHLGLASATAEQAAADRYSFDALKYDEAGVKHESFQASCAARGLLRDDLEWRRVLGDACVVECCARNIRMLYVYILVFNTAENARSLLEEFWEPMAEDLKHSLQQQGVEPDEATLRAMLLAELDELLRAQRHSLSEYHVPFTEQQRARAAEMAQVAACSAEPKEIREELPADRDALRRDAAKRRASLRPSQLHMVDAVLAAVNEGKPLCAFVDAPGGTGKTFSFNAILSEVRSQGEIALAVASSGIAAIILALGRTFHSRFKPPWIPAEGELCNISAQSGLAKLLRRAKLILWDEAPMTNRFHLESLDLTLRDLMKTVDPSLEHVPFGGKACGTSAPARWPRCQRRTPRQPRDRLARWPSPAWMLLARCAVPGRGGLSRCASTPRPGGGARRRLSANAAHLEEGRARADRRGIAHALAALEALQPERLPPDGQHARRARSSAG